VKQSLSRCRFVACTAGAAALTLGGGPYVIAAPTKEIVIGLDVPQSGPYAEQGADQLRAYHLAIDEINAKGGIMGMKIKATEGDDQTKPGVATENAQRMIARDGAIMITGGASAAYGSDAIAGVINFKLRDRFSGAELNYTHGATTHGDGATEHASALLGGNFADGRGNGEGDRLAQQLPPPAPRE